MHKPVLLIAIGSLLMPAGLFGQAPKAEKDNPGRGKQAVVLPLVAGIRYQGSNRRDPFLDPIGLKRQMDQRLKTNDEVEPLGQAPPGIAGMYIAQVALVGISTAEAKQTAVFRGADKRAYFLQSGDRLFDGFVKNIGAEEVLMVRETKLRSGKVLSQEVMKRLRTP